MDVLPPEAFWAGLVMYPVGGYLFFQGARRAIERAEIRTARALNPRIGNRKGDAFARLQAQKVVNPHGAPGTAQHGRPPTTPPAQPVQTAQAREDELMLYEVAAEPAADRRAPGDQFAVTSDVSFPLETQEQQSLATQLEKLNRLREEGIITADEMARAKTKLLS